jgi:polyisoprenyl-teichoic acid--peptidoglycan teichoic acid transferase
MALSLLGGMAYVLYVSVGLVIGMRFLGNASRVAASTTTSTSPLAAVRSIAGLPAMALTGGNESNALELLPDWRGSEPINVLLLGIDQREDEREIGLPTRSDTLIVLSIDPVQKTAAMVSFPRDLWVTIPGFVGREERINAAYRFGELSKVEGGGVGAAARTIEANFGLKVPYYAVVDFGGFQDTVNMVGGIVVDVPRPLKDDEYPTEDYGIERIFFLPGPQIMDGATALKYARTRHADTDFGRMARQQQVILGVRDRALRLNMVLRLPSLLDQGLQTVRTNFTPTEIVSLGKLATQIDTSSVGSLVIDNQLVTPYTGAGGAALLMPKRDEIRRAIQRALADPRLLREGARVEVAASTARGQVAGQLADRLAAEGLTVTRTLLGVSDEPATTRVITYSDKPRTITVVLDTLRLEDAISDTPTADSTADVRIVLGRDFQFPLPVTPTPTAAPAISPVASPVASPVVSPVASPRP